MQPQTNFKFYNNKFSLGINKWANACLKFEGYFPGSNSYKCNNPGNIRCGGNYYLSSFIRSLGAVSCSFKNFAMFRTPEAGYEALCQFLLYAQQEKLYSYNNYANKYNKGIITLRSFYEVYAPVGDFNSPNVYANYVAKALGVPGETPIKNI